MKVAGLILAAGGGSRIGRPKAELVVGGRRLVDRAIESCVRAGLDPVVVVMGAVWLTPSPLPDDVDPVEIWLVDNIEWATGMASSLRAGIASVEEDAGIDAVVVTLVDTPGVGAAHLRRVSSVLSGGAAAVAATYDGHARLPVALTRRVWSEIAGTVSGDDGARGWLRAHPELVTEVECSDLGPWTDIDTVADLR